MRRPRIHLINRFESIAGSELRALNLARLLSPHAEVRLWATDLPDPELARRAKITVIEPRRGHFPHGGTFVFVGVYYHIGRWIRLTRPSRRIIVFNTPNPEMFVGFERATARTLTRRPVSCEVVYASELLQPMLPLPGIVQESPIDLTMFRPRTASAADDSGGFRVGRLSRDAPQKFHEDDADLFAELALRDVAVRVMGGTCIGLANSPRIEILPAASEPAPDFLRGLDCFLYRTHSTWLDSFARVVFEAMACGLPVVAGRVGGYASHIEHGVNGYLFDTNAEAMDLVLRLRNDRALRARIGTAARQTVERLYDADYEAHLAAFYTGARPVIA